MCASSRRQHSRVRSTARSAATRWVLWLWGALTEPNDVLPYARIGRARPVGRLRAILSWIIALVLCVVDLLILWNFCALWIDRAKHGRLTVESYAAGFSFGYSVAIALLLALVGIVAAPRHLRCAAGDSRQSPIVPSRLPFLINLVAVVVLILSQPR